MFKIEMKAGSIRRILDMRYDTPVDITDGTGRFGLMAYTLSHEDISKEIHPECMPFSEKYARFREDFTNAEYDTRLIIKNLDDEGLLLELICESPEIDGMGMYLPFNFISRKNGFWQQQFTVSSPYHTADHKHRLFYLARPDGNNIVCIVENEIECFTVNYSPYQGGHFIRGITFWSQLDQAYGRTPREHKCVRVRILPVSSYVEAMQKACRLWDCSALYYQKSAAYQNERFFFEAIGQIDELVIVSPSGNWTTEKECSFCPTEYGMYTVTPYHNGKAGMDCTVFCMDSLLEMHERATKIIRQNTAVVIGRTADGTAIYEPTHLTYRGDKDFNLCEHCMWGWSALKYLRGGGKDNRIEQDVRNLLNIMDPENQAGVLRCTYDPIDHYNTLGDYRIQEAFNGVNILLDAYLLYREHRYLELAKTVLRSKLEVDQLKDGGVYRYAGEDRHREDYTTVTAMVLPVADLAVLLREENDPDWEYFSRAAIGMADHVLARGMDFPTEGGADPEANAEVEEGSMSCAALTVLYVYDKLLKKPEYLEFAGQVLALHDSYSVYTPQPCMFRSSLRWWETIWEGDSDGPAICFGHAWTIWRAEAEYWYGILLHDDARLLDSYNGFMTNFAKTDKNGNMYAIYQYEQLSSPAAETRGWMTDRRNREGFPGRTDQTLSRYGWARAAVTWFETVAILPGTVLMAKMQDNLIVPEFEGFKRLYIGDVVGEFYMRTSGTVEIISKNKVTLEGSGILKISVT